MNLQEELNLEAEETIYELMEHRDNLSVLVAHYRREIKLCAKREDIDGCLANAHEYCEFRKAVRLLDMQIDALLEAL